MATSDERSATSDESPETSDEWASDSEFETSAPSSPSDEAASQSQFERSDLQAASPENLDHEPEDSAQSPSSADSDPSADADPSVEAARLLRSIIEGLNTEAEQAVTAAQSPAPLAPPPEPSFELFGEESLPVLPPPPAPKQSLPRPTLEVLVKIPPEARKDTREAEVIIPPEARRPPPISVSVRPSRTAPDSPPTEAEIPFAVAGDLLGSAPTLTLPVPKVSLPVSPQDLMLERLSGAIERYEAASEAKTRGPRTEEFELPSFNPPPEEQELPDDQQRAALFAQVRDNPLDADAYHLLADYFDRHGDVERGDLMAEIATALEAVPEAPARVPRLLLSARDRSGLRHPQLRGEAGELLSLCGSALCQLFPTEGRAAGSRDQFHLESGPGAQAAADAVLAGVRILGSRAPDLYLSEDAGPPFSLVFPGSLRLLVGRAAVKKPMPAPELRFFAGRALFTQSPDLLALRSLSVEELTFGIQTVGVALLGGKRVSSEAWTVREVLSPKAVPRLKEIFERVLDTLDLDSLAEGARHSANRAGLIVAGAVAPALGALRAKKALDAEIAELVRFAASERYLHLRARRIPG